LNEAGQYERAAVLTERMEARAREVAFSPVLADVLVERGRALVKLDRWTDAETVLEEAALQADEAGLDEVRFRARLHLLALLGERLERKQRAATLEREVAAVSRRLGPDDLRTADTQLTAGAVANALGRYEEGTTEVLQALELRQKRLPENHPDVARAFLGVARSYNQRRLSKEALSYADEALRRALATFGADHPELVPFLNERAIALQHLDRWSESEAEHRRALAIAIAAYGQNHTEVARTQQNLAQTLRRFRRWPEALTYYDSAIAIIGDRIGKDNQMWGSLHVSRGSLLSALGRYDEARKSIQVGLPVLEEVLGNRHTLVAWGYIALAMLEQDQRHYPAAEKHYAHAIDILEHLFGKDSPELVYPMHRLAISIDYQSRKRSLPVFKRVLALTENNPQSVRDHAWAQFHTGITMIDNKVELEEAIRLIEAAQATFFANGWDPQEYEDMAKYLAKARRLLGKKPAQ
jgi:tetratricopeptide (TPR) repeat protein